MALPTPVIAPSHNKLSTLCPRKGRAATRANSLCLETLPELPWKGIAKTLPVFRRCAFLQLLLNLTELTYSLRQSTVTSTSALWAQAYPEPYHGGPDSLTPGTETKQRWLLTVEVVKSTTLAILLCPRMGGGKKSKWSTVHYFTQLQHSRAEKWTNTDRRKEDRNWEVIFAWQCCMKDKKEVRLRTTVKQINNCLW